MPEPCLIYHFTALSNLPDILSRGGLHCKQQANPLQDISDPRIQVRRSRRAVPLGAGGVLHDYVPFYFGPRSPMLHRIAKQDRVNGTQVQADLVYLITSAQRVAEQGLSFVFTDGHAEMREKVNFYADLTDLSRVPWAVIQAQNWRGDDERRQRQSEFLVRDFVPFDSLIGFATQNEAAQQAVESIVTQAGCPLRGAVRPQFYW